MAVFAFHKRRNGKLRPLLSEYAGRNCDVAVGSASCRRSTDRLLWCAYLAVRGATLSGIAGVVNPRLTHESDVSRLPSGHPHGSAGEGGSSAFGGVSGLAGSLLAQSQGQLYGQPDSETAASMATNLLASLGSLASSAQQYMADAQAASAATAPALHRAARRSLSVTFFALEAL